MERAAGLKRRGKLGLGVAAVAITIISLGGPLLLASGRGLGGVAPFIPFLWAAAIGGWVFWLRDYATAASLIRREDSRNGDGRPSGKG